MECNDCGIGEPTCIDSTGGTKTGRFEEKYECRVCGAAGTITGRAESPASWVRYGSVFNA